MTRPNFAELAEALATYFPGRSNAYALQQTSGRYVAVRQDLGMEKLVTHCQGLITVGRYLLTVESTIKFAAFDYDTFDPATRYAILLAKRILGHFGIPSFIEWSGRKGFHLLIPFKDFIAASKGRRLLNGVLASIPEEYRGVKVEVFPKQVERSDLGSLIKLPWGIHRVTGKRSFLLSDDFKALPGCGLSALQAAVLASDLIVDDAIAELADVKETEQLRNAPQRSRCGPAWVVEALAGVPEGNRDNTCFRLAVYFRNLLPQDVTLAILTWWGLRCTPPFREEEVAAKVKSAYGYQPRPVRRNHRAVKVTAWEVSG